MNAVLTCKAVDATEDAEPEPVTNGSDGSDCGGDEIITGS